MLTLGLHGIHAVLMIWSAMLLNTFTNKGSPRASVNAVQRGTIPSDVKLRNAHLAIVDRSKVLDYLLNEAHPDNGGKARFFASLGFSREDPEGLIKASGTSPSTGRS
jgi:hypothetical protein